MSLPRLDGALFGERGELAAAQAWAADAALKPDAPGDELRARGHAYHTLARLRIVQQPAEALRLLDRLAAAFEGSDQIAGLIETQLLTAIAQRRLSRPAAARAALTSALQLAAPENFIREQPDEGAPLAELLADLRHDLQNGDEIALIDFIDRILAAMSSPTSERPVERAAARAELIEPLSDRELVILRHIADGLSNQEIAHRLIVAVSTVKWHVNNIYAKLNAHSRTLALARARELQLL